MPARQATPDEPGSAGGLLARLRDEHKLGQANLGQIDPTSETIKLATLGMRNIAATLLWKKANDYKMREDWTAFSATAEQIIKVEPNFPTVWTYQGWNLSYNISAEFDDYRDRYFWVMKGVRFLQDGIAYNETAPQLIKYLGWVISQKIGIADEKLQYRRLFREDNDFHGTRPLDERDNWLVGRQYYLEAERVGRARANGRQDEPARVPLLGAEEPHQLCRLDGGRGEFSKRRPPWPGPLRIATGRSSAHATFGPVTRLFVSMIVTPSNGGSRK